MAGNFVDTLAIGIGIDASQVAQGVQQVGAQLDSGLSAAAQSAATKLSPLGEASSAPPIEESADPMVLKLVFYLNENYKEEITLEKLCAVLQCRLEDIAEYIPD